MQIRHISLILVTILVASNFLFDSPTEYINLALALTVLLGQATEYLIFRKNLKGNLLFKIKSNEWINGWIMVGLLMYWFSNEEVNSLNITAISALIVYGILASIQLYQTVYTTTDKGILNLSSNILIQFDIIQDIEIESSKISLHTLKSRNEIVIQKSKVVNPIWEELTTRMTELKNKKANISSELI